MFASNLLLLFVFLRSVLLSMHHAKTSSTRCWYSHTLLTNQNNHSVVRANLLISNMPHKNFQSRRGMPCHNFYQSSCYLLELRGRDRKVLKYYAQHEKNWLWQNNIVRYFYHRYLTLINLWWNQSIMVQSKRTVMHAEICFRHSWVKITLITIMR